VSDGSTLTLTSISQVSGTDLGCRLMPGLVGQWRSTSTAVKIVFFVLLVLGSVMLVLGAKGDATGFWADRPFLTNVFSSLTAAMFGIPIALAVLHQIAAAQASHAAEVRQRTAAKNLLEGMTYRIADGFPETSDVAGLVSDIDAFGRTVVTDQNRSQFQSEVREFLTRWDDAFVQPRYDHAIAALANAGEQLSIIRTLALENGWRWRDAIPADTSPPPDSSAINAWRRRAFPAQQRGWGWEPDEPRWEGLAEARECARRVQEYHTDVHNAWYLLRDR
jgi:hypothetical protein